VFLLDCGGDTDGQFAEDVQFRLPSADLAEIIAVGATS
jgi:hypothetical protein